MSEKTEKVVPPPLKLPKSLAGGIPRLPASRFTPQKSGGNCREPHCWKYDFEKREKILSPGFSVVGYCDNLPYYLRINRDDCVAVMFRDPDGFDVWFHVLARYEIEDGIPLTFKTR